jgi:hypothetical protein
MTQMPQSSRTSETMNQDDQGEKPAPAFQAFLPSAEPPKRSRLPLVFLGLGVLVLIGGLLFWGGGPDGAEADKPAVDVRQMTAEQLAEVASVPAARELVRRRRHGTPAEQAAAASVMNHPSSARLARNLAIATALEHQNRANEMRVNMERDIRMAEEGY